MTEPFVVARRHVPPSEFVERDAPQGDAEITSVVRLQETAPSHATGNPVLAPFAPWLDDPDTTDVFVNGVDGLFVDRGLGPQRVLQWRAGEQEVHDLAVALVGLGGRHIDDASPCVDVRLDSGLRIHAVLAPIARGGAAISLRVPRFSAPTLDELQERGAFSEPVRGRIDAIVASRKNFLITGAAGCGKTTLLAAMLQSAPHAERIVSIEDVAELAIAHPHHVRLEARQANLEGAGGIDLARLVREALRMRPDRLVVGECRGSEVRDLLAALNTGHDGGAGTLHANSLDDVPARLEALGALAGLSDHALARQAASGLDAIIHLTRTREGHRFVEALGEPVINDGRLCVRALPVER